MTGDRTYSGGYRQSGDRWLRETFYLLCRKTGPASYRLYADLTQDDLPAIKEKLFEMKKVSRQVSDVVASQTALATGEVDIVVGGGTICETEKLY